MRSLSDFKGQPVEQLFLETQMGQVQGASVEWKFGYNTIVGTTEEDIWEQGGLYPFPTSASTLSVVSTANDTMEIFIDGLDADFNRVSETITLTGVTPVITTNSYLRVNRAYNNNGTPKAGAITFTHAISGIIASIPIGSEQTLQALATIPSGFTAYLFQGMASVGKGKDAQIFFKYRLLDKVFRISETFGLYESTYEAKRPFIVLPEKTDLKVSAITSVSATQVSAQFGILLLNNSIWKD